MEIDEGKHASLLDTALDREKVRLSAIIDDPGYYSVAKVFPNGKKIWRARKFGGQPNFVGVFQSASRSIE